MGDGSRTRLDARTEGHDETNRRGAPPARRAQMSHSAVGSGGPDLALLSLTVEPAVILPVLAVAAVYLRGFMTLRRRLPERFGAGRVAAFATGLGSVVVALCSGLDALGQRLLTAHMIQHMILLMVAPPLIWMGAPVAPLLLGLPRTVRRRVARGLGWLPVRTATRALANPVVSWVAFVTAFWAWHVPALYDAALRSDVWHHIEHACFLATAMLFWRPVILAWPARSSWPRWATIPYLVLADLQNSVLAAILTFSDRVIYQAYEAAPRAGSMSALEDQSVAGVIMWVPGSIAFLLPVIWLVFTGLASAPSARTPLGEPTGRDVRRAGSDR
jgi:cytochrome c oxidase assembly factor CtaG